MATVLKVHALTRICKDYSTYEFVHTLWKGTNFERPNRMLSREVIVQCMQALVLWSMEL